MTNACVIRSCLSERFRSIETTICDASFTQRTIVHVDQSEQASQNAFVTSLASVPSQFQKTCLVFVAQVQPHTKHDNVNVNRDATKSVNLSGADDKIAKQSSEERQAKAARSAASVQRIVILRSGMSVNQLFNLHS
jgi:hypothetical protein